MTRSELIEKIAAKMPNLTVKDIDNVVSVIFNRLTKALADGDRVELRGFGAFSVRKRNPRVAINPKTKEKIQIAASKAPAFKAAKAFKDAVK